MHTKGILISGAEDRFQEPLQELRSYLVSIGCEAEIFSVTTPQVLKNIRESIKKTRRDQPVLVLYNGHGTPRGWESRISYLSLAWVLLWVKGDLLIVNDTCYGFSFLKYVKLLRSPRNTSFISPWDSRDVSYGGPVCDALTYWPRGMVVEDEVTLQISSTPEGDIETPIQLRWGARLEKYFFPT